MYKFSQRLNMKILNNLNHLYYHIIFYCGIEITALIIYSYMYYIIQILKHKIVFIISYSTSHIRSLSNNISTEVHQKKINVEEIKFN